MKIEYDKRAKSVYIHLTDIEPHFGIVDHTQEITEDFLIDWMKDGSIWGVGITNVASKPIVKE